ncbi:hypothetical protein GCM10009590_17230 [Brachybacterium alimentarium]
MGLTADMVSSSGASSGSVAVPERDEKKDRRERGLRGPGVVDRAAVDPGFGVGFGAGTLGAERGAGVPSPADSDAG